MNSLYGLSYSSLILPPIIEDQCIYLRNQSIEKRCAGTSINAFACSFSKPVSTIKSIWCAYCPKISSIFSGENMTLRLSTAVGNLYAGRNVSIVDSVIKGDIQFKGEECILEGSSIRKIRDGDESENQQKIQIKNSNIDEMYLSRDSAITLEGQFNSIESIQAHCLNLNIEIKAVQGTIHLQERKKKNRHAIHPFKRAKEMQKLISFEVGNGTIVLERESNATQSVAFYVSPELEPLLSDIKKSASNSVDTTANINLATIQFEENQLAISNSMLERVTIKGDTQQLILTNSSVRVIQFEGKNGRIVQKGELQEEPIIIGDVIIEKHRVS